MPLVTATAEAFLNWHGPPKEGVPELLVYYGKRLKLEIEPNLVGIQSILWQMWYRWMRYVLGGSPS